MNLHNNCYPKYLWSNLSKYNSTNRVHSHKNHSPSCKESHDNCSKRNHCYSSPSHPNTHHRTTHCQPCRHPPPPCPPSPPPCPPHPNHCRPPCPPSPPPCPPSPPPCPPHPNHCRPPCPCVQNSENSPAETCDINPSIKNLCSIMKRYENITSKRLVDNICQNTNEKGVYNTDFGFSCIIYSSHNYCKYISNTINVDEISQDFASEYVDEDNHISCPSQGPECGLTINENVKVISSGCLKIVFLVWYKVCNKYNYDVYYAESNSVKCPPENAPCLCLSFYDSIYASPCEDCYKTQRRAVDVATQILSM
jgi:hypothetical protein